MIFFFISVIVFLSHLSFYMYFKDNFRNYAKANNSINTEKHKVEAVQNTFSLAISNSVLENKKMLLHKSLKQLEFIAEFEMYLEEKTLKNLSLEFLQEFEKIKMDVQLSTLKTTHQLNTNLKIAA